MTDPAIAQASGRNSLAWAYSVEIGGGIQNTVLGTLATTEDPAGICHCSMADLKRATGEREEIIRRAVDLLIANDYVYRLPREDRTSLGERPGPHYILLHDDTARKLALDHGWGLPRDITANEAQDIFAAEADDEPSPEAQRYIDFLNTIPFVSAKVDGGGVDISGHGWLDLPSLSAALQVVRWEPGLPDPPSPEGDRGGSGWPLLRALRPRDLRRRLREALRGRR